MGYLNQQESKFLFIFGYWFTRWMLEIIWEFRNFSPIMSKEASMAARRPSPAPFLLSSTHSQFCPAACSKLGSRYGLGSIFCWVNFSSCQSDHHTTEWMLEFAEGRVWYEGRNEQGWVWFLLNEVVHLKQSWNYSISLSSGKIDWPWSHLWNALRFTKFSLAALL